MICASSESRIFCTDFFSLKNAETTLRKPRLWIVMSGVIATIAATPNAKSMIWSAPRIATQAPIIIGRMKLLVRGPLATPPESNAIAV